MSFKITGPGEYKLRDGGKVTITGPYTGDYVYQGYAWVGSGVAADGYILRNQDWLPSGKFDALSSRTTHLDIVGPWQEFNTLEATPETDAKLGAKKDNVKDKKPPYKYIGKELKDHVANAHLAGEIKYGDWNFLQGHTAMQLLEAMERHIAWVKNGVNYDKDCSLRIKKLVHHLGCVGAGINMYLMQEALGTLVDDRPRAIKDVYKHEDITQDELDSLVDQKEDT